MVQVAPRGRRYTHLVISRMEKENIPTPFLHSMKYKHRSPVIKTEGYLKYIVDISLKMPKNSFCPVGLFIAIPGYTIIYLPKQLPCGFLPP